MHPHTRYGVRVGLCLRSCARVYARVFCVYLTPHPSVCIHVTPAIFAAFWAPASMRQYRVMPTGVLAGAAAVGAAVVAGGGWPAHLLVGGLWVADSLLARAVVGLSSTAPGFASGTTSGSPSTTPPCLRESGGGCAGCRRVPGAGLPAGERAPRHVARHATKEGRDTIGELGGKTSHHSGTLMLGRVAWKYAERR